MNIARLSVHPHRQADFHQPNYLGNGERSITLSVAPIQTQETTT